MADSLERVFEIIIVVGIILLAAAIIYFYSRPAEIPEEKLLQCLKDSDCALVKADCCGCGSGGKNTALNKAYIDYWTQKLDRTCRETACYGERSIDISCSAQARCIKSVCTVQGFV